MPSLDVYPYQWASAGNMPLRNTIDKQINRKYSTYMQTFLPYGSDFKRGAESLDYRRLVKQAVEGYQILRALSGVTQGWRNHPATKMWKGHEGWLIAYLGAILDEMDRRGYSTATRYKIHELADQAFPDADTDVAPPWLRDERVAITHRGRLYEKDPAFYSAFAIDSLVYKQYTCCERCNYYWPTHTDDYGWIRLNDRLEKM